MKRISLTLIFLVLLTADLSAIRARRETASYTQPDGSTFLVNISGDEWCRIITTKDGCAIARDPESGFWCYATYDSDGRKHSSGHRVGSPAPGHIIARSRDIPVEAIRTRSAIRREEMHLIIRRRREEATRALAATTTPKEMRVLMILAQTPDKSFSVNRKQFVDLMTQEGYSYNGATGCAAEYFTKQLDGTCTINFTVSDIVTLPKNMSYYASNNSKDEDSNPAELVATACQLAHEGSANPVDFSIHDGNGDGKVDNLFVMVPGGDEADGAGDDCIWSHSWAISAAGISLTLDGVKVDDYAISTELTNVGTSYKFVGQFTGIGTFCHEFSHLLGLCDLYDTDYTGSGGNSNGMFYTTALMDGGNMNNKTNTPPNYNAVDLDQLGLGTCETMTVGRHTLQPIGKEKKYFKIETDYPGEYYLVECRDNTGWDKYIEGKGLAVYHIDKSDRIAGYSDSNKRNLTAARRWDLNEVNCRPDHQCAEFVAANPRATDASTAFFPYGKNNSFSASTTPVMKWWSGAIPDCGISDIVLESDGSVSFTYSASMTFRSEEIFQDAIILSWSGSEDKCTLKLNGTAIASNLSPAADGCFHYLIEGLTPNTQYTISVEDGSSVSTKTLKTKAYYEGSHPFIYLVNADRDDSGKFRKGSSISMRVYNAPQAKKAEWTFNGKSITPGYDCHFTIPSDGILKAYVTYEDGSTDIIVKEIKTL